MTVLFGGSLLFWATAASLPGIMPEDESQTITATGTPLDNYPDVQREQFCSSGETAKSNTYVTEYKIPTPCTQPLAIVTDPDGNVWFTQTNTGSIAKFDPKSELFTEYENPQWPKGGRSMMWGIDYSPDGSLWYTEEATDAIWKFLIDDEKYERTDYPTVFDSLPQRLSIEGSIMIVNDFSGNKLTFLDPTQTGEGISYLSVPSPVEGSVTGAFAVDSQDNVWYTNWIFQQGGVLVKLNQTKLPSLSLSPGENTTAALFDLLDIYKFPPGMNTPNGISAGSQGNIWISDTSSSFFFSFNPDTESFTKYITSVPSIATYGNSSGVIKNPVSRPYWNAFENDRLVFNEQTANRIGVFNPADESLVEYLVPSKNPNWADCELIEDCGLAQIFDFTIDGEKIWFTEWVENNIGVIDTSIPLPFEIELEQQKILLNKGEQAEFTVQLIPTMQDDITGVSITSSHTAFFSDLTIDNDAPEVFQLDFDAPRVIRVSIAANESALPDIHKVIIGAQTDEVTVSKYVTVIIEQ